jgi:hypothetical protein
MHDTPLEVFQAAYGQSPTEQLAVVEETFNPTQGFTQRSAETNFMLTMTHGRKLRDNTRYERILKGHSVFMNVLNRYGFSRV